MNKLAFGAGALAAAAGVGCSSDAPGIPEGPLNIGDTDSAISVVVGDDDDDDDGPGGDVVTVDPARELLITDLSVVEDPVRTTWPAGSPSGPQAAWTFGRLIEKMAGSANPSQFCMEWLERWGQDQVINGFTAPARPAVQTLIIDPWLQASGGQALNLRLAPFRLLAIVNRIDLRSKSPTGQVSAGEGRFVFGFVKPDGSPSPFTIIFEFGVPAKKEWDVIEWAEDWHELGEAPFGPGFNAKLQKLTDKFSGPNCLGKPNKSCLNQLRTNEIPLNFNAGWEMREYTLLGSPAKLTPAPMVLTPDGGYNGSVELADFINANADAIKLQKYTIDPSLLGASSLASLSTFWDAPGIADGEARHSFALSTCNGCHTGETGTNFLHVTNRAAGVQSALSAYMTGVTVVDPASGVPRTFNELERRKVDMAFVLTADVGDLFPDSNDDDDNDDD